MNKQELLAKIDSEHGAELFTALYGKSEINAAKERYKKLLTETLKEYSKEFTGCLMMETVWRLLAGLITYTSTLPERCVPTIPLPARYNFPA